MASVALDYHGPYTGTPMTDDQYTPFMSAVHQGEGGGVISGGAVTLGPNAQSFSIAPFVVIAGGRLFRSTSTKTVAPTGIGALRNEFVVVWCDPVSGAADIRTQTTTPVAPSSLTTATTFQVELGRGQTTSTAPQVRNVWSRGRSYPQGSIRVDDISRLDIARYESGQGVWDELSATLYVKSAGVWTPAIEGPRQHYANGAQWLNYDGTYPAYKLEDTNSRVLTRETINARKKGIYSMYAQFDIETFGPVRVECILQAYQTGGAAVLRAAYNIDTRGIAADTPQTHTPNLACAFDYPEGQNFTFRAVVRKITGAGSYQAHKNLTRLELVYQPSTLSSFAMTNLAVYDEPL